MARYISLYSGSSGNCSVVEKDGKFILIDVGKSAKITNTALKDAGLDIKNLQGVLVSHEHSDHINGLKVFLKNIHVPLYTNPATADYLVKRELVPAHTDVRCMNYSGENLGDFFVTGFDTPHDSAGCMGFRVHTEGGQMAIATDLGHITENVLHNLSNTDLTVIEANYDNRMLADGPYPYYLKERIDSDYGHLSNIQSGLAISKLVEKGAKQIQLCHLSQTNNTPTTALTSIAATAKNVGIVFDKDVKVRVNSRNSVTRPTFF